MRDTPRPLSCQSVTEISTAPPVIGYASGHRFLHGFLRGRTGKEKSDCSPCVYHPVTKAACDAPPPRDAAAHSDNTSHRTDALQRSGHESVSMLCHTYGVQPGHGRTSRSGGSPVSHGPHRIVPPSGSDSRGKNRVALVFLALDSTSFGHKESPRRIAPNEGCYSYAVFDVIIIAPLQQNILRNFGHHGFPNSSTVRRSSARFFFL